MPVDAEGNPIGIPFEVVAPGCPIDGLTGVFDPLALSAAGGPCGPCGTWGYAGRLEIPGKFWNFDGISCDLIPVCTIEICMTLTCDATQGIDDDSSNEACCRRMRLYVATTYNFAGATNNGGAGACAGLPYEIWLGPDSCTCGGGLSAIFSLGVLTPLAVVNPNCGLVQPCVPDCDMSGIKVVI